MQFDSWALEVGRARFWSLRMAVLLWLTQTPLAGLGTQHQWGESSRCSGLSAQQGVQASHRHRNCQYSLICKTLAVCTLACVKPTKLVHFSLCL